MNVKVGTDSVTGPVAIVQTSCPEVLPGKKVQVRTRDGGLLGPDDPFKAEYTQQYSSVGFFLEGGWWFPREMNGPSNVSGSIVVLTT